jgi:hypothetical protein
MPQKRVGRRPKPAPAVEVTLENVPSPDAQRRLARSFDLILHAAVRQEQQKKR